MKDMEITRLQTLIDAYMKAETTPELEAELKRLVAEVDDAGLPGPLAADVRLVRMLLGDSASIPMPEDFGAQLLQKVDALEQEETKANSPAFRLRRRLLRLAAAGVSVAAAVLLLFFAGQDAVDKGINTAQTSTIAHNIPAAKVEKAANGSEEMPKRLASNSRNTVVAGAEGMITGKTSSRKVKKTTCIEHGASVPATEVETEQGVLTITEYYDHAASAQTENADYANAPVVIRTEWGESLTYESLDQSPEALAMMEQAFQLLNTSNQELEQGFDDSKQIIKTTIKGIEK